MLKFRSLLTKLTKNSLLVVMLAVALVSSFAYMAGAMYGYGYGGSIEDPEYDLTIKKNLDGDIPDSVSDNFMFDVTGVDPDADSDSKPNVTQVSVSANDPNGTSVTLADQTVRVSEQVEPIKDYELTTDYYLSQIKDVHVSVQGNWGYHDYQELGFDDLCSDMYFDLDLDDSSVMVSLDVSDGEALDPNLPYFVNLSRENEDGDYEEYATYEVRTSKPELLIKDLPAGHYCLDIHTEYFSVQGWRNTYDSYHGVVEDIQTKDDDDGTGCFIITRYYGHHGVTKYSVLDPDGNEVFVGSIGPDTENQQLKVTGLDEYMEYTIKSDDMTSQKYCSVKAINAGEIDPEYLIQFDPDVKTELNVTNHYKDLVERGDLIIRKYLYGSASNKADRFDFRLSLYDGQELTTCCDHNEARYGCYFDGGIATFSLLDNESRMATNIPVGLHYSLEEYDDTAGDYSTVIDGTNGTFSTTLSEAISISTRIRGSYKYVHEYYIENEDGSLNLEGTSDIYDSPDGLIVNDEVFYTSKDVEQVPEFTDGSGVSRMYTYMGDAYGTVNGTEYSKDPDMDHVLVTENGEQIIVLQYKRPAPASGGYKYVHEYYFEDLDGNRELEGVSDIQNSPKVLLDDSIVYTSDMIVKEPVFEDFTYEFESGCYANVTPDLELGYLVNPEMSGVIATKGYDQVIVLRYIRYEDPVVLGSYKYVHEYYSQSVSGNRVLDGVSAIYSSPDNLEADDFEYTDGFVRRVYEFDDKHYEYESSAYGYLDENADLGYSEDLEKTCVYATEAGDEVIVLKYIRYEEEPVVKGGYVYIHEYYLEENGDRKLEGKSNIGVVSDLDLGEAYDESDIERVFDYNGNTYEFLEAGYGDVNENDYVESPDKTCVYATEDSHEIVILRYIRHKDPVLNKMGTYKYVHEYYFENSDGELEFEGASAVSSSESLALDDTVYLDDVVERAYSFTVDDVAYTYEYKSSEYGVLDDDGDYFADPAMQGVKALEDGSQIIILKYVRREQVIEPVAKTGGLIVTKSVTGEGGDKSREFVFTVVLDDESVSGTYGDMEFVNGECEFTLTHGMSKKAESLPAGLGYSIFEEDLDDYDLTAENDDGEIKGDTTITASFVNAYMGVPDDPEDPDDEDPEDPGDQPVDTPNKPDKTDTSDPEPNKPDKTTEKNVPVLPSSVTPSRVTPNTNPSTIATQSRVTGGTVTPTGSSRTVKSIPDEGTPLTNLSVQTGDIPIVAYVAGLVLSVCALGFAVWHIRRRVDK